MKPDARPDNVAGYIAGHSPATRRLLKQLRATIRTAAPGAEEKISYGMPAYKLHGMLAYFAGYKNHIGLYPGTAAIKSFKKELISYKTSKGTVQFPLDQPLPLGLIRKLIGFQVARNKANLLRRN